MKLLLDSHVLIWAALDTDRLSARLGKALSNPETTVYVSAVSFWEISLKYALGKLELVDITPEDLCESTLEMGFELLPLSPTVASTFHTLPQTKHKDPFDRMLAWQAICGHYTLASRDKGMAVYKDYGLRVLW